MMRAGTLPLRKPGTVTWAPMVLYASSTLGLSSAYGTSTLILTRVGSSCSTELFTVRPFNFDSHAVAAIFRPHRPKYMAGRAISQPDRPSRDLKGSESPRIVRARPQDAITHITRNPGRYAKPGGFHSVASSRAMELVRSELLQSELACSRRCPLWPERPTFLSAPCGPRWAMGDVAPPRRCRVSLQPRGKHIFRSSARSGADRPARADRPLSFRDISSSAQECQAVQKIGSIDHSRTTILIRPCLARPAIVCELGLRIRPLARHVVPDRLLIADGERLDLHQQLVADRGGLGLASGELVQCLPTGLCEREDPLVGALDLAHDAPFHQT